MQTRIYESERNRPQGLVPTGGIAVEDARRHEAMVTLRPGGITPEGVADLVHDGVVNNTFYVLTTDAFDVGIRERSEAILARRNPEFTSLLSMMTSESDSRRKS